jgi:hypothetical protein
MRISLGTRGTRRDDDRLEDLVAVISYPVDDEKFRVKNSVVNRSGDC